MTAMKRHEMVMHSAGDGPHTCPYCNKEFQYKYSMYYHKKLVHETVPHLKCQFCDKKFRRKQEVQLHELVHTGVKAFKCNVCDKAFRTNSQLSEHEVIHKGMPRFQCPDCDKAFMHRSSYKRHVLLHRGELPYQCPHCEKAFPDRSNMLSHVRHIHKDQDPNVPIQIPKYRHAPARLPRELRKYPKPRSFAADQTIETTVDNTTTFQIIKQDPEGESVSVIAGAGEEMISNEMLQSLLASAQIPQDGQQVNIILNENGEYVVTAQDPTTDAAAAAATTAMKIEEATYDESGNVVLAGGDHSTFDLAGAQSIDMNVGSVDIEMIQQQGEGEILEAGQGDIETVHIGEDGMVVTENEQAAGIQIQQSTTALSTAMEGEVVTGVDEKMNFVEVETDTGEKQVIAVPQGVQFVQVGDQVLQIS